MKPALVYDGDCPFCSNYVELLKLRETWPDLELVNVREMPDHAAVAIVRTRGLKIDDGMAIVDGDLVFHGAEAIHELAEHGGPINRVLFRSKVRSEILYPFLRFGRNAVLKLLNRQKLGY